VIKVVHPRRAWEAGGCRPSATRAGAPDEHPQNARTTPYSRLRIALRVDGGEKAATVAADFVTDAKIAWRDAYEMQMRAAVRPLQQAAE